MSLIGLPILSFTLHAQTSDLVKQKTNPFQNTILIASSAVAQEIKKTSHISRMMSLRADEVNVRTGPGVRYPVKWIFKYKTFPVEVIEEYEVWRKIRDNHNEEGWVHQAMLSPKRFAIIASNEVKIRKHSSDRAPAIARLLKDVVVQVDGCNTKWCLVEVSDYKGWVESEHLWGIYDKEEIR